MFAFFLRKINTIASASQFFVFFLRFSSRYRNGIMYRIFTFLPISILITSIIKCASSCISVHTFESGFFDTTSQTFTRSLGKFIPEMQIVLVHRFDFSFLFLLLLIAFSSVNFNLSKLLRCHRLLRFHQHCVHKVLDVYSIICRFH